MQYFMFGGIFTETQFRPYQQECLDIIEQLDPGAYLVVMATGLGKTYIFTHIKRKGRVLILSHREELVHQPEKYYDCSFGVERAEESSDGEEVISASVQTLIHRLDKFKPDDFDIIITDEAHHAVAPSYQKIYAYFRPRLHLGFTATPNRADNAKLGNIYSKVIYEKNIKWGIQNNYLSDIRCKKVDIGYDLRKVRTQMGDFHQGDLDNAINITECNEAIARVYQEHAVGPTVIFAASVAHANNIAALIPGAKVISADTKERGTILQDFAEGRVPCIVNCMVLTEGTDLPMIRTVMMCRPTSNASLYTQAVGRGLRLYEGKEEMLLIDCVGASRLSLCTAPMLFGLDPEISYKAGLNNHLLTEAEELIEKEEEEELVYDPDSWKINVTLINIFEQENSYQTFHVNYTMCANRDMVCSMGEGYLLRVKAEDMTGNSSFAIYKDDKLVTSVEDRPMQEILRLVFKELYEKHQRRRSLWDRKIVDSWGKRPVSEKQISLIKYLIGYNNQDEIDKIDFKKMTQYQATCLINQKKEEKRRKFM